jgi:hypothetical protein
MISKEPPVTVQEVSMQEWAMLAFHAERAPQRVRVTVRTGEVEAADGRAVGGARTVLWVLLATTMAGMTWWLI